ncbi:MAG: universal stress protein [Actinomycetota bacterium]
MSIFPAKVLLAVDGSGESDLALRSAVDLSRKTGSELHVVHVGLVPTVYRPEQRGYGIRYAKAEEEARHLLEEQVEKVKAAGASAVQAHLRMGRPDAEIVALAEEIGAGLIVLGSRGLGGMKRVLMGSVSDSVVRHAHCPVLVVRR